MATRLDVSNLREKYRNENWTLYHGVVLHFLYLIADTLVDIVQVLERLERKS